MKSRPCNNAKEVFQLLKEAFEECIETGVFHGLNQTHIETECGICHALNSPCLCSKANHIDSDLYHYCNKLITEEKKRRGITRWYITHENGTVESAKVRVEFLEKLIRDQTI